MSSMSSMCDLCWDAAGCQDQEAGFVSEGCRGEVRDVKG